MPGQVVTVMNMKGGVGKTTVTAHIGAAIARSFSTAIQRQRVLLIDYDPQFNLSQTCLSSSAYKKADSKKKTVLSILTEDDAELDPFQIAIPESQKPPAVGSLSLNLYGSGKKVLDLIPSTLDLMYLALGRSDHSVRPIKNRFKAFVTEARAQYDLIFIDCHPAGSLFTDTSLTNSDHVLIPVAPSKYAARGIGLMMEFIRARSTEGNLTPHILFNDVPRTGTSEVEAIIRGNRRYNRFCMTNTLKHYKAFLEPSEGEGFVWTSNKAWSGTALQNLNSVAREFYERVF